MRCIITVMQKETIAATIEEDGLETAHAIVDLAEDKKASDITLMDLRASTTLTDYFVIVTGSSSRQIGAISSAILEGMTARNTRPVANEGRPDDGWMILDFGQVIVHIFAPAERAYYDLERRWQEAATLLKIQ